MNDLKIITYKTMFWAVFFGVNKGGSTMCDYKDKQVMKVLIVGFVLLLF